jgi:hypothetical protein
MRHVRDQGEGIGADFHSSILTLQRTNASSQYAKLSSHVVYSAEGERRGPGA